MSQSSFQLAEFSSAKIYGVLSEDNPPLDTIREVSSAKVVLNGQCTVPVRFEGPNGIISEQIIDITDNQDEGGDQENFAKATENDESCHVIKLQVGVSNPLEKSIQTTGSLPTTTYPFAGGHEDNESQRLSPINSLTSSDLDRILDQCTNNAGDRDTQEGRLRNEILCNVPVNVEQAMQYVISDNRIFNNIIMNIKHALVTGEIQKGRFTADSNEARQFEHTLESMDNRILGAVLGAKLWNRSLQSNQNQNNVGCESPSDQVSSQVESKTVAVQAETSWNENISKSDTQGMDIDDDNAGTPYTPSTVNSCNVDSRPQVKLNKEQTWGRAHDAILTDNGPVEQALCVCRILFDDVMTRDDILNRSRRAQFIGQGKKRRKTEPFQPEKLDFIKNACAFILSTPERKDVGTAQFETARRDKSFKSLKKEIWEKIATPLLGKYASTQRKSLE